MVESFQQLAEKVLSQTVWGVDFYMLCDRDIADDAQVDAMERRSGGRLQYLRRYHLENYFLDAAALARVFEDIEPEGSWLRDDAAIEERLRAFAIDAIPYAVGLIVSAQVRREVGNASVLPKGLQKQDVDALVALIVGRASEESQRVGSTLDATRVEALVRETYGKLEAACASMEWKSTIPGKQVLSRFAGAAGLDLGRLKLAYIKAVQRHSLNCFDEIVNLFDRFSTSQADASARAVGSPSDGFQRS